MPRRRPTPTAEEPPVTPTRPTTAPSPAQTLRTVFGYPGFRGQQEAVIDHVIAGGDAFVIAPTGGGKSICFQLPALHRDGTGIVVSPLISLMKDQVDALLQLGVRAAFLNSSLEPGRAASIVAQLREGELDLLYVAPERFVKDDFQTLLSSVPIALVAVDEAHCISQWGHDFRPEYVAIGDTRRRLEGVPFMALTATADEATRRDVIERLHLHDARVFTAGFDRPNIRYLVEEKRGNALDQVTTFLAERPGASGIVYALSRKRVDELARRLGQAGFSAAAYHAGMSAEERTRVQDAFLADRVSVVVATVAFGMGIDKPDVRFVVHADMPRSIESYYQETGRAGRDGAPADALLLFGLGDVATSRALILQGGNDDQNGLELRKLDAMVGLAEALTCRRRVLLGYFGETLEQDCGNCDVCLTPPERYDATTDAQMVLSAVYRLGRPYGVSYVIDILRGAETERVLRLRHDALPTHGVGAGHSKDYWTSVIRQLIHGGYLFQDVADYSVLRLTERAAPVLRGDERVELARPVERTRAAKKPAKRGAAAECTDPDLFETLRELRRSLAAEQGVPAYVVFHDATLLAMADARPADLEAMATVSGVGETKLERYGEAFLAAIAEHEAGRAAR
jgi:ATP-dependent DNA helicase RecQ